MSHIFTWKKSTLICIEVTIDIYKSYKQYQFKIFKKLSKSKATTQTKLKGECKKFKKTVKLPLMQ